MSGARPVALLCTPSAFTEDPATADVLDLIYGNSLIHLAVLAATPFDRFGDDDNYAEHAARVQEVMTALALRSQIVFAGRSVLPTVRQLTDVDWRLVALWRCRARLRS